MIVISLEKKQRAVKNDQYNPIKDPSMVKLVFSLRYKDGK